MLKFISYKQVTTELVSLLRESGYDVFYVASLDSDMDLTTVCQKANSESYILLTGDSALADEAIGTKRISSGLIYVQHLPDISPLEEATKVLHVVQKHQDEMAFSYTRVIGENVKIKKLEGA